MHILAYIIASCIFIFGMQLAVRQIIDVVVTYKTWPWLDRELAKKTMIHTLIGLSLVVIAATCIYIFILVTIYQKM